MGYHYRLPFVGNMVRQPYCSPYTYMLTMGNSAQIADQKLLCAKFLPSYTIRGSSSKRQFFLYPVFSSMYMLGWFSKLEYCLRMSQYLNLVVYLRKENHQSHYLICSARVTGWGVTMDRLKTELGRTNKWSDRLWEKSRAMRHLTY